MKTFSCGKGLMISSWGSRNSFPCDLHAKACANVAPKASNPWVATGWDIPDDDDGTDALEDPDARLTEGFLEWLLRPLGCDAPLRVIAGTDTAFWTVDDVGSAPGLVISVQDNVGEKLLLTRTRRRP